MEKLPMRARLTFAGGLSLANILTYGLAFYNQNARELNIHNISNDPLLQVLIPIELAVSAYAIASGVRGYFINPLRYFSKKYSGK